MARNALDKRPISSGRPLKSGISIHAFDRLPPSGSPRVSIASAKVEIGVEIVEAR